MRGRDLLNCAHPHLVVNGLYIPLHYSYKVHVKASKLKPGHAYQFLNVVNDKALNATVKPFINFVSRDLSSASM